MVAMQNHLWSATNSFGLNTAYSMVRKAWREYERCSKATNSDDRRDAAINCAITLWHMTDWVWAGIAPMAATSREVAKLLEVSGRRPEKSDLVKWALKYCPELEICQSICNGSKHVTCEAPVETKMTAPDQNERGPGRQLVAGIEIVDKDGTTHGMNVLYRAFEFWYHQASSHNVLL